MKLALDKAILVWGEYSEQEFAFFHDLIGT